jgi:hypothetical protein
VSARQVGRKAKPNARRDNESVAERFRQFLRTGHLGNCAACLPKRQAGPQSSVHGFPESVFHFQILPFGAVSEKRQVTTLRDERKMDVEMKRSTG